MGCRYECGIDESGGRFRGQLLASILMARMRIGGLHGLECSEHIRGAGSVHIAAGVWYLGIVMQRVMSVIQYCSDDELTCLHQSIRSNLSTREQLEYPVFGVGECSLQSPIARGMRHLISLSSLLCYIQVGRIPTELSLMISISLCFFQNQSSVRSRDKHLKLEVICRVGTIEKDTDSGYSSMLQTL